jgi:hypothetical protein
MQSINKLFTLHKLQNYVQQPNKSIIICHKLLHIILTQNSKLPIKPEITITSSFWKWRVFTTLYTDSSDEDDASIINTLVKNHKQINLHQTPKPIHKPKLFNTAEDAIESHPKQQDAAPIQEEIKVQTEKNDNNKPKTLLLPQINDAVDSNIRNPDCSLMSPSIAHNSRQGAA